MSGLLYERVHRAAIRASVENGQAVSISESVPRGVLENLEREQLA